MATFPETTTLQDFYNRALAYSYEGAAVNPYNTLWWYGEGPLSDSLGARIVTGDTAESKVGSYPSYTWISLYERFKSGQTDIATFMETIDEDGTSYANYTLEELYAATDGAGFGSSIVDPAGTGDAAFTYSVAINSPATTVTGDFAGATAGSVLGLETEFDAFRSHMLSGIGSWAYGNNGFIVSWGNPLGWPNMVWSGGAGGGAGTLGAAAAAEAAGYLGPYDMGIYREIFSTSASGWHSLFFSVSSFAPPTFESVFGAAGADEETGLIGGIGTEFEGLEGHLGDSAETFLFSEQWVSGRTLVTYDNDEQEGLKQRFGTTRRAGSQVSTTITLAMQNLSKKILEGDVIKTEVTFNSIKARSYIDEDTTAIMGEEAMETVDIETLQAATSTALAPTTSAAMAWAPLTHASAMLMPVGPGIVAETLGAAAGPSTVLGAGVSVTVPGSAPGPAMSKKKKAPSKPSAGSTAGTVGYLK